LGVKILTLLTLPLAVVLSASGADLPKNQPKTEAALIELEQTGAAALSRKDADAVACMLATEFEDATSMAPCIREARRWSIFRTRSRA